jgi:hypothetical protein
MRIVQLPEVKIVQVDHAVGALGTVAFGYVAVKRRLARET